MERVQHFQDLMQKYHCCVLIPTFNNAPKLKAVLEDVGQFTDRVIVVNDGSTDETGRILRDFPHITVLSYVRNMGKGYALLKGFKHAVENGYNYAITLDSDGQHKAADLPKFLEALEENPGSLIVGSRNMEQDGVPGTSSFGHRFSNFWYKLETGINLPDTQSGYRLYPITRLRKMKFYTSRYELELEILVRAAWNGLPIKPTPIDVVYPEDRITHFRKIQDFTRISILNTIFVLIAFFYIKPRDFFRNFKKENRQAYIRKHVLMNSQPNWKIAISIGFGVFMGIVPIWGYQIITGIAVAHLARLSKFLVVAASNISIPPFIPFIIYGSFKFGGLLLDNPGNPGNPVLAGDWSYANMKEDIFQYIVGAVALAFVCGAFITIISYFLLVLFRKDPIIAD